MYRLNISIKVDDLEFIRRLQDDLQMVFSEANLDYLFSIDNVEEEERQNRSIRDTMRGYAAPPPEDRHVHEYQSMTREQWVAYKERYQMMEEMRIEKHELEKFQNEMPEFFEKENFIKEEEMKL